MNHEAQTDFAASVAKDIVGEGRVEMNQLPVMGGEDFSYMLNARPGAYLNIGQGFGPDVHNTEFNFNDEVSPIGASFFARLVETAQPVKGGAS